MTQECSKAPNSGNVNQTIKRDDHFISEFWKYNVCLREIPHQSSEQLELTIISRSQESLWYFLFHWGIIKKPNSGDKITLCRSYRFVIIYEECWHLPFGQSRYPLKFGCKYLSFTTSVNFYKVFNNLPNVYLVFIFTKIKIIYFNNNMLINCIHSVSLTLIYLHGSCFKVTRWSFWKPLVLYNLKYLFSWNLTNYITIVY